MQMMFHRVMTFVLSGFFPLGQKGEPPSTAACIHLTFCPPSKAFGPGESEKLAEQYILSPNEKFRRES